MNHFATITAPAFDINMAHMEAHRWVETAHPLIVAYLALDQIQSDVIVAGHEAHPNYANNFRVASHRLANEMREMHADITAIRDTWIGDLSPPPPNRGVWATANPAEVEEYDDLCEIWEERIRDVLSVDAAIHAIIREAM